MHFSIEKATRESGEYVVYRWESGDPVEIFKRSGKKPYGGLKECRQAIGAYLQKQDHSLNKVFKHHCIIHDRKQNWTGEWTVEEYLIGVPFKK